MNENEGNVPCPYCEEEKTRRESDEKKYNFKYSKNTAICRYCLDTHFVDWVDAIVRPQTSGTSGTSGMSGITGQSGIPVPYSQLVGKSGYMGASGIMYPPPPKPPPFRKGY